MRPNPVDPTSRTAIVVFEDRESPTILRWLRPGYRHCFCALGVRDRWLVCDPLKGRTMIDSIDGVSAHELAAAWLDLGARVLIGSSRQARPSLRLAPFTCVEIVKSLLGLDLPGAVTPFQLWRALCRKEFGFGVIEKVDDPGL